MTTSPAAAPATGRRPGPPNLSGLSGALHRALRPALMPDPRRPGWAEDFLREVCDAAMTRVAADPPSAGIVARALFARTRSLLSPYHQLAASQVIERYVARARDLVVAERGETGSARRCAARNRKGKPCGREPMWGTPYCVSHAPRSPERSMAA